MKEDGYVDLKMVPHGIGLRNVSKTQLINAEMLHNLVCTVATETINDSKQLYYTSKMTLWPLNLYDASFNWN